MAWSCSYKSLMVLSRLPRHAETGGRHDLALHFVDAAAEGVDLGRASRTLQTSGEVGVGRARCEPRRRTDDVDQQPVHLDVRLGAEHLHRRRIGWAERAV